MTYDLGIHCLPLIQQFLDMSIDSNNGIVQILGQVWEGMKMS